MKFREFMVSPEVKKIVNEIVKHDTNYSIISIGVPEYHFNNKLELKSGNGSIDLFILTDEHPNNDDLSIFLSDYEYDTRKQKNVFRLFEEPFDNSNPNCYTLYAV